MLISKEEKNAIHILKFSQKLKGNKELLCERNAIEILLNLTEKQQKEIRRFTRNELKRSEVIATLITNHSHDVEKIKNKDKIIDLMAKTINKSYFNENEFELWFEKEIYMKKNSMLDRIEKIKEYFIKKVGD